MQSMLERIPYIGIFIFIVLFLASYAVARNTLVPRISGTISVDTIASCMKKGTYEDVPAPECLREVVGTLLATHSTRELMSYIVASSSPAIVTDNCHPIGHIIGEQTFKEVGTLEGALSLCPNSCRSACTHGALGAGVTATLGEVYPDEDIAHASIKEIGKIGSRYCSRSVPLCHGIGHVLFVNTRNYRDASAVCQEISTGFSREACYQGVFMEAAGGNDSLSLGAADASSKPNDYTYPCATMALLYQHACFQLLGEFQNELFKQHGIEATSTRTGFAVDACRSFTGASRAYCFEGMGVQWKLFTSEDKAPTLCEKLDTVSDRQSCTIGIASTETYQFNWRSLTTYCDNILESDRRSMCYNTAFEIMGAAGTKPYWTIAMCQRNESNMCARAYKKYLATQTTLPDYRFGLFGEILEKI